MATILDSPSAERNKEPIFSVLSSKVLPLIDKEAPLRVLEIAAGCGVHTEYFVTQLQEQRNRQAVEWCPTDPDAASRASIQGRIQRSKLETLVVQPPLSLTLDCNGIVESTTNDAIGGESMDLVICINMIHISEWDATLGLVKACQKKLCQGGVLFLYGPFKIDGTAVQSNLRFDQSLRNRNPLWGVRDLERVTAAAQECGLKLIETVEMPANNLCVYFQKS